MRSVFVADHRDDRDFTRGRHPLGIVGLIEEGVHPLQYPLGDAGGLAQPDRPPEDEDVCREDALSQIRPVIPRALVAPNARLDVVIGRTGDFTLNAVRFHPCQHVIQQLVGRTRLIS